MLRIRLLNKHRRLKKSDGRGQGGSQARIDKLRKLVTAVVRHERIEGKYHYMDETRGYVERLIQIAATHGDQHQPTMDLADYWLLEKDLIHKLFKVLVPRYTNSFGPYTAIHRLPDIGPEIPMSCLELKGNPWPPILTNSRDTKKSLVNILLDGARRDYRESKYKTLAKANDKKTEHGQDQVEGRMPNVETTVNGENSAHMT